MKQFTGTLFFLLGSFSLLAQQPVNDTLPASTDSVPAKQLAEVVVKAYEQNRRLRELPAAVNLIGTAALERFSPFSLVQAVNTSPGVRMEERSPGSYRFNIRGSSLRSPFGVRNVKVYYNDLPYTQPGGVSYINQFGFYNIGALEIIKGPGSSLYGAGTGGVLLLEHLNENEPKGLTAAYTAGSFQTYNAYGALTTGNENTTSRLSYQHQQSDGYRRHSGLRRDVLSWTGLFRLRNKQEVKTTFFYSDLFYETPGALTATEYQADPKAARPGTAVFPGSEAAKAAVFQKTFMAGASYRQAITNHLENKTSLYGAFTQLRNPNIRGYDQSAEPHAGGRTVFTFSPNLGQAAFSLQTGAEWQEGTADIRVHKNNAGKPDSLRTADDLRNRQSFLFAQALLEKQNWIVTAGASWNSNRIRFQRYAPQTAGEQNRRFHNNLASRFAVLKKWKTFSVYTSVAKGFSPPSINELLPTGGSINLDLNAETGTNYDLGIRGSFQRLWFDVNTFYFRLKNTIVQRRDAAGGDFYTNSGRTRQHGVETQLRYSVVASRFWEGSFWLIHTWHYFRYKDFKQINNDFSGKRLPGVAPHTLAAGFDGRIKKWSGTVSYFFSDQTPLNDANTAFADAYHLVGVRVSYRHTVGNRFGLRLFAGAENLLDETYSLGNDINAFGGRYFNAAPGRSFFAGVSLQVFQKTNPGQ